MTTAHPMLGAAVGLEGLDGSAEKVPTGDHVLKTASRTA